MPELRLSGGDKGRVQASAEGLLTARGEGAEAEAEELGDGGSISPFSAPGVLSATADSSPASFQPQRNVGLPEVLQSHP